MLLTIRVDSMTLGVDQFRLCSSRITAASPLPTPAFSIRLVSFLSSRTQKLFCGENLWKIDLRKLIAGGVVRVVKNSKKVLEK